MEGLNRARQWLSNVWTPTVMVVSSEEADSLCQAANGLSVVGLLRPFGILNQLNGTIGVPVRTVGEAPFRLHTWRLRFYAGNTMFQPAPEAADTHLKSVLSAAAAAVCDEDVPQLQDLMGPGAGDATPWYGVYRDEFLRMMAFGDHETQDHPLACVLVLPSTVEGDPVVAFEALYARSGALPPLMQQGIMEPRIPKHYVLLHDASTAPPGTLERAQQLLRQMSSSSGSAQCHLLVMNTRPAGQPPGLDPSFWAAATPGVVPGGGTGEPASYPPHLASSPARGAGLSERDVAHLAEFVRGLAVTHIIPSLETRVRALNHQVTSTRKGLRNQLKSLLWRKAGSSSFLSSVTGASDSPSAAPSTPTTATAAGGAGGGSPLLGAYPASSVEGEMRALSDLSLMLRDYETAISTLRLLASDFKQDKAWKHYAAVQEALGVATVLSNGSAADAVACFKEGFYRYQQLAAAGGRARWEGTRYATRTAMMLAEYLRAIGQHGEAHWVLMKAHFQEENLRAGLLLEQAAHSLLRLSPSPHVRKFAFHLVLAGLRYNLCEQKGLALRAYKQVLGVYEGKRWALIEEHLHDVLGRQSREAGDWLGAVQHYMAMVLCPANSLYCQRAYLAQFLDVLRQAQAELGFDPPLELPVPVVEVERVGLQYDSQTGYGTPEARAVKGMTWALLEAAVQPAVEGGPVTWLDGGSRASLAQRQPEHSCVVGEPVCVEVELYNPLAVELAITRLRLACTFEPAAGAGAAAAGANGASDKAKTLGLQIREESLTLGRGERVTVQLRLVPLKAGSLGVDGVQWVLNGVAQAFQRFRVPRPKPRKPGSSKPLLDAERPAPGGVSFTVLPPMPHLEVSAAPLPPTLAVGELLRCPLRLRNTGAVTMHTITLAVGSPDMVLTAAEVVPAAAAATAAAAGGPSRSAASSPRGEEGSESKLEVGLGAQQLEGIVWGTAGAVDDASGQQGTAAAAAPSTAPATGAAAPAPGRPPKQRLGGSIGVAEVGVVERGGVTVFTVQTPGGGKLGVGQDLHLLLWLRPSSPGLTRFNCVWYYEPVVKLDSLRFRTLRTTYAAQCLPSLDLAAALVGGRSVPGTCLLQLHAVNRQSVEGFRLTGLECVGGAWHLAVLQQQQQQVADGGQQAQEQQQQHAQQPDRGGGGSSTQELDVLVAPEAAATVHYHLAPAPGAAQPLLPVGVEPPPSGEALREGVAAWLVARGHPRRRKLLPAPSTASLQAAAARAAQQQQQAAGAAEEGGRRDSNAGELSIPVDIVVRWEVAAAAAGPPRTGFHVLYQQRVAEGPPLHVQLLGPASVNHDFSAAPFATVPLTLRVRNTLLAPASVCIETYKQPDGRPTPLGMPSWAPASSPAAEGSVHSANSTNGSSGGWVQPTQPHLWCGRTRVTLPCLAGGQTVEVPLHVAAAEPGSLVLSDYLVSWSYAQARELTGSRPGPACYVLVQQQAGGG